MSDPTECPRCERQSFYAGETADGHPYQRCPVCGYSETSPEASADD